MGLGLVHGFVGLAHRFFGGCLAGINDGDANAGSAVVFGGLWRSAIHLAHTGFYALGYFNQQQVARRMAVGIVKRLEVIQIKEKQRAVASAALAGQQGLGQAVVGLIFVPLCDENRDHFFGPTRLLSCSCIFLACDMKWARPGCAYLVASVTAVSEAVAASFH